jgi:outer membrane protein
MSGRRSRRGGEQGPHAAGARRWAVGLALSLCGAGVGAQSLVELYAAARDQDATVRGARALAASAEYRAEQVRARLRPSLSLAASSARSSTEFSTLGQRYGTQSQVGLTGRQPLYNPTGTVEIDQALRSLAASQAELAGVEQDLLVRLAQAYFDVLAAQDSLATVRTSKAAIAEQLASARRNFEVGNATITDTREAQARFDLATAQELGAENDLRSRRVALNLLVGRPDVQPRPLAAPLTLPEGLAAGNAESWVDRARSEHPQVRRAELGAEIARLETERARAQGLPTVDAVASVDRRDGNNINNVPAGVVRGVQSVGVQLNMPLFAGYAIQNRIRETLLLEDRAREDLEAARRTVTQATQVAWLGVQSGQAQVRALEAAEASSRLALEATQTGYRVGVRVNIDVLNAQTQLFTTQRDLSRARYEVLLGSLRLRQAAGQLSPDDLRPIEQLIAR